MNDLECPASGSTTRRVSRRMAIAAAVALSATTPRYETVGKCASMHHEPQAEAATGPLGSDCFPAEAHTVKRGITHDEAAAALSALFRCNSLRPDREGKTGDSSLLFEFLRERSAFVDLYPTGELILVLQGPEGDVIHDLLFDDRHQAIELLHNAGFSSSV